jgi:hypothetical protein
MYENLYNNKNIGEQNIMKLKKYVGVGHGKISSRKRHFNHFCDKQEWTELTNNDLQIVKKLKEMSDKHYTTFRTFCYVVGWNNEMWDCELQEVEDNIRYNGDTNKSLKRFYHQFELFLVETKKTIYEMLDIQEVEVQKT